MSKKIYVGNLNYGTGEEALRNLFSQYGEVASVSVITDKYSGESKGFGFVEMGTAQEAETAINALNGQELEGRRLRVDLAQERSRDDRGGSGGGGGRRDDRGGRSSYRY